MAINIIDKNLSFNSNHTNRKGKVTAIVLHHAAATTASVEDIHRWHKNEGYAGIGYHFYVRKDGSIYRGRPEAWQGGHATNHNEKIGICAEGNFETDTMSTAQKKAIASVIAYLFDKYGNLTVYKHSQVNSTACPGKNYPFDDIIALAKNSKAETTQTQTAPTNTKNLVKEFQDACIADGIKLRKFGADGLWGTETATAAAHVLTKNSKGKRVVLLQTLLIKNGYKLPVFGADGHFGEETKSAVKAFQKARSIGVDGIVGIDTWKAILGV